MQTIVAVFAKGRDALLPPGKRPGRKIVHRSQKVGARRKFLARRGEKSAGREKLTQPFWTWFIENPRSRGVM